MMLILALRMTLKMSRFARSNRRGFGRRQYPQRPLLKLKEFRIRKHQLQVAKRKKESEARALRAQSIELLSRQAPVAAFELEERTDLGEFQIPHFTHRILALNGNSDTIYCKACGWWSSRLRLRGLALRCQGLHEGNRSSLRMLECGVVPGLNAKIPPHLTKRRQRESRW